MTGLSNTLNGILKDTNFMELLEEEKRRGFLTAVANFQKTYQKLIAINKMHGGTTMAKYEKILGRVEALMNSLDDTNNTIWQGLRVSFFSIHLHLGLMIKNLSCFKS